MRTNAWEYPIPDVPDRRSANEVVVYRPRGVDQQIFIYATRSKFPIRRCITPPLPVQILNKTMRLRASSAVTGPIRACIKNKNRPYAFIPIK